VIPRRSRSVARRTCPRAGCRLGPAVRRRGPCPRLTHCLSALIYRAGAIFRRGFWPASGPEEPEATIVLSFRDGHSAPARRCLHPRQTLITGHLHLLLPGWPLLEFVERHDPPGGAVTDGSAREPVRVVGAIIHIPWNAAIVAMSWKSRALPGRLPGLANPARVPASGLPASRRLAEKAAVCRQCVLEPHHRRAVLRGTGPRDPGIDKISFTGSDRRRPPDRRNRAERGFARSISSSAAVGRAHPDDYDIASSAASLAGSATELTGQWLAHSPVSNREQANRHTSWFEALSAGSPRCLSATLSTRTHDLARLP